MFFIILSSLVFTTVNSELAFIWLSHQQIQCTQNTRNYRDSVHHQYFCIFPLTWTCVRDANVYTNSSVISLDYFCGFIDVQNALQSHTIWNIHVRPNVHVHFLKFSLFTNYWYCDFEYLTVMSKNKNSIFCGDRLPWIYDALDFSVSIILSTQRSGSAHYQIELQYYGAFVPNYQHFVIFIQPSSGMSFHLPNVVKNDFESFHFISNGRLDILHLTAAHMDNKWQIICYDGPGIKSPTLRFKYNQSDWKCLSSTFQMFCKLSAPDFGYSQVPRLHYHATRANDEDFIKIDRFASFGIIKLSELSLQIHETQSSGTTKYIHNFTEHLYHQETKRQLLI